MSESAAPAVVWQLGAPATDADARAARTLGLAVAEPDAAPAFYLARDDDGLALHRAQDTTPPVRVDLLDGQVERRMAGGRRSPLARALGLRRHPHPRVLDATAGLGRDAATLAGLGCQVTALERHPALYALLDDARQRAAEAAQPPSWLARWPELLHADAADWLAAHPEREYDVIYIDPMFDAPRRKARPQKALAWMHALIGEDHDVAALLDVARRRAVRQVVVKQHARTGALADPDRSVEAKAVRFDVYLTRAC